MKYVEIKACNYIAGIETVFNEALSQIRFGMNPRAANLATTQACEHESSSPNKVFEAIKVPNVFGGYNIVSSYGVEAITVPEKFARERQKSQDSATTVDFTIP